MSDFNSEPNAKRQRILDDIALTNINLDLDEEDVVEENEPMTYDELIDIDYEDCYACKHMNVESLNDNEKYLYMMRLYSQNASTICRNAIFEKIKQFFDEFIKPDLILIKKAQMEIDGIAIPDDTSNIKTDDWTMTCIKQHFDYHTNFPTDEILIQLRIKRALRSRISNHVVEITPSKKHKFNINNIKLLITLDKEIQSLLKQKKDISSMIGYSAVLDF
jgi:hypothetical protein